MGMEPFVAADAGFFGPLINSIPNPLAEMQKQLAFKVGLDQQRAQTAGLMAQAQEAQQKQQRTAEFQQALSGSSGKPQDVSDLMMRFPEYADELKKGWDVRDEATRNTDLTHIGQVYSPAAAGDWGTAQKAARERYDADKAAGQADPDDDRFMEAVDKAAGGDETARKFVLNHLGMQAAAAAGPTHFASVYGAMKGGFTLDAGATRYDENGNVVAQSPYLKGPDGAVLERNGTGGTSAGAQGAADPAKIWKEVILPNEGGYAPHDGNGAPVNFGINQGANPDVDVKNLTPEKAEQLFIDRYWKPSGAENLPAGMAAIHADTYYINPEKAQGFLQRSGGDPNKYMQMREAWLGSLGRKDKFQRFAKAWTNRNANLREYAGLNGGGGGSTTDSAPAGFHTLVPGKKPEEKDSFSVLTPDDPRAANLPRNATYQINNRSGQITAVGGQSRQAKQIPQQVQSKLQPVVDIRDTMNRLAGTWKDDFGGHTVTGGALNSIQGVMDVGPQGMRDWWADFQSMDNQVRNQLFGSALTEHEKQAYASTTITPRMAPDQIKKNLARRRSIVNAATARQQNFLKKNGYDPEAVDAMFQPLGAGGGSARTVVRRGRQKSTGRPVVQYSDGTVEVQ